MSPAFEPHDPDYEQRGRETFPQQGLMATCGAGLRRIEPAGRNRTVCRGDAYVVSEGDSKHVATMTAIAGA